MKRVTILDEEMSVATLLAYVLAAFAIVGCVWLVAVTYLVAFS